MENIADKNAISQALREIYHEINKRYAVKSRGVSMLPFIEEGSEVVIQYTRPVDIKLGDIIAFRRASDIAVHRVIGKHAFNGKVYFIEKGDNTLRTTIIPEDAVIGKVTEIRANNANIKLDQGFWVVINRIMGVYGYISGLAFKESHFIKSGLFGERKTFLAALGFRFFKTLNSGIPILLIGVGRILDRRNSANTG